MKNGFRQLLRFGLVGATNTVVAYLTFALFLFSGCNYAFATLLGGTLGALTSYVLTRSLVFESRGHGRLVHFSCLFLLLYVLNISIQKSLHSITNNYLAGAIATVICFSVSFFLNKFFVFREDLNQQDINEYDARYAEVQILRSRNFLRRLIRHFYLRDILRFVDGPSIDFGCGSGDMLARLPPDSIGFEINPSAVSYCRTKGLKAELYEPEKDDYQFSNLEPGAFTTILFTHVLEHLEKPEITLRKVIDSCQRLKIQRLILTVPCERGFKFDTTHKTFITKSFLTEHALLSYKNVRAQHLYYFPINTLWVGRYYTFHELHVVIDIPATPTIESDHLIYSV